MHVLTNLVTGSFMQSVEARSITPSVSNTAGIELVSYSQASFVVFCDFASAITNPAPLEAIVQ